MQAIMAGSNYANTGSLNDARELQKMFKGQSSDSSSGKNRGRSKGGNSLPMKRQGEIYLGLAARHVHGLI